MLSEVFNDFYNSTILSGTSSDQNGAIQGIFTGSTYIIQNDWRFQWNGYQQETGMMYYPTTAYGSERIYSLEEKYLYQSEDDSYYTEINLNINRNLISEEKFLELSPKAEELKMKISKLILKIEEDINNPNNVKVVVDQNGFALYFSRSVIPYSREKNVGVRYFQHIGIYAFRKQALLDFYSLPMQSLEASEKLEQLRYLEFGKRIKMVETSHIGIGIDTPEDLEKARLLLKK